MSLSSEYCLTVTILVTKYYQQTLFGFPKNWARDIIKSRATFLYLPQNCLQMSLFLSAYFSIDKVQFLRS